MLVVYICTIFVGAGLVFLIQPMVAKMVLPLLGGSPAVWTTCMVFYQAVLLGGYLYAHGLTRFQRLRTQWIIHMAVLAAPLLVLPVRLRDGWSQPFDGSPVGWLLLILVYRRALLKGHISDSMISYGRF